MVIPKQYPYELWQFVAGGESVQDGEGNWIVDPGYWSKMCLCRDEVNSKGSQITVADGTAHVYDSLILLPRNTPTVHVGSEIEVRNGAAIRTKGTVKRYDPSQLHSRIWI